MVHGHPPRSPARPAPRPLDEREIDELQALLDRVPALEPLDVTMLDGYLCGVLLQPQRVPEADWLAHVTDVERGRPLPPKFDPTRLHQLVKRRAGELNAAIVARQWFDPWVFELESDEEGDEPEDDDDGFGEAPPEVDAVYPWVAGFAAAVDRFPWLMQLDAQRLTEPLALVFQHLDADDLEDADDLLAEIETMEPPADLTEAVETLVRATLLLADISRPQQANVPPRSPRPPARRPPPRR